jgi:hypothetical protein
MLPLVKSSLASRDWRGRKENGDGKRAPRVGGLVCGVGDVLEDGWFRGQYGRTLSRTESAISEDKLGYLVAVSANRVKYSRQMEKPWWTNHARVDMAWGR